MKKLTIVILHLAILIGFALVHNSNVADLSRVVADYLKMA